MQRSSGVFECDSCSRLLDVRVLLADEEQKDELPEGEPNDGAAADTHADEVGLPADGAKFEEHGHEWETELEADQDEQRAQGQLCDAFEGVRVFV